MVDDARCLCPFPKSDHSPVLRLQDAPSQGALRGDASHHAHLPIAFFRDKKLKSTSAAGLKSQACSDWNMGGTRRFNDNGVKVCRACFLGARLSAQRSCRHACAAACSWKEDFLIHLWPPCSLLLTFLVIKIVTLVLLSAVRQLWHSESQTEATAA